MGGGVIMVEERLNMIFDALGAGNSEVARYCGFDRTNISRLRSGKRKLRRESATAGRLVGGICRCAADRECTERLWELTGSGRAEAEGIREGVREEIRENEYDSPLAEELADWLFEGEEERWAGGEMGTRPAAEEEKKAFRPRFSSFGERLDAAMQLAEMSNVRLSRLVHTDASLISRYRSGVRTPRGNPRLVQSMSAVLYDRIVKRGKKEELARLMRFSVREVDEEYFAAWMIKENRMEDHDLQAAERLLRIFDSFTGQTPKLLSAEGAIPEEVISDERSLYIGTRGLQSAVLRFLSEALRKGAPQLLLYSDEDQGWLTSDREFLARWAALMSACVRKGTRIRIIHNVDRDLDEMNDAIESWLPLYMSGRIDSAYCKKQRDPRFSHTIFLWPGEACIAASHVLGTEVEGLYHYYTGQQELEICAREYDRLLESSRPLMKIVSADPGESDRTRLLPQPPLENISLVVAEDYAEVTYVIEPHISIRFTHPLLCRAFREYAAARMSRREG